MYTLEFGEISVLDGVGWFDRLEATLRGGVRKLSAFKQPT